MRLRTSRVATTVVDGRTVILDTVSSEYLTTNRTGTAVISLLQADDLTQDELVARLAARYEVALDVVAGDCERFVDQLRRRHLLDD